MLPGETEAGPAGMQPCRGIAQWKLIEDDERGTAFTTVPLFQHRIDRFPHALKIPARSAESSLTQLGFTPIPAEPGQKLTDLGGQYSFSLFTRDLYSHRASLRAVASLTD